MSKQSREVPAYGDPESFPGRRLPWDLPWEPWDQEEGRSESDPGEMPDDEDDEESEADERGGGGAAIYPPSEHLALG